MECWQLKLLWALHQDLTSSWSSFWSSSKNSNKRQSLTFDDWACPLNNSPKVGCGTAKLQVKKNQWHKGFQVSIYLGFSIKIFFQGRIQVVLDTSTPVWMSKLRHPNNTMQVLSFQLHCNKKYVKVAKYIIDH